MKKIKTIKRRNKTKQIFSMDVIIKNYIIYTSVPVFKRYVLKIRRKLEIIHMQDEYKQENKQQILLQKLCVL